MLEKNDEFLKDTKGIADKLGKINPEMFHDMISISGLDIALEKSVQN